MRRKLTYSWYLRSQAWLLLAFAIGAFCFSDASGIEKHPQEDGLIGCWRFEGRSSTNWGDASGHGFDAFGKGDLRPVEGIVGGALAFSGQHLVTTKLGPDFSSIHELSFSAWVQPTRFERYNEILRKEDGDRRVLFSFQEHGTVLSLGLNIGGYVECDAAIDPEVLLDGAWHHCGATFDGRTMRVFLDGREVGKMERSGLIQAGGNAPVCLGSLNGGECFQGAMDEVKVYGRALSVAEVEGLFREGLPALERREKEVNARTSNIYEERPDFADALAACRANLARSGGDQAAALAVAARLVRRYPADAATFLRLTKVKPAQYLLATNADWNASVVRTLLDLVTEYKPLTPEQWARQNDEQEQKWQEAEALERRFSELRNRGDGGQFSSDWVRLFLDSGRDVQERPWKQEAVAPFIKPATPHTRSLTVEEGRLALERDWLHQADQNPTPERIRQEIGWATRLAVRICARFPGAICFDEEIAELTRLESHLGKLPSAPAGGGEASPVRELYFKVRDVKRRIFFRNPVIDFDQVLFVDVPFPQGSEWQHETRHRLGYMAVPGGRLLVLQGLSPSGELRQLMPREPLHGSFWRPDLSYDGRRVVFCFKPHNEKSFHLYEMNLDGSGLRQITDGPYDDLDPIYLPDESHVVFSTTRGGTYVRCMPPTSAFVLARISLDGQGLYLISANNEPDYLPSVMPDGRVLYTRWEYTDKPLWRAQKLWTIYPDGSQVSMFWGNQSVWPDVIKDARAIPGSNRVMFTGSAHHNWFAGSVGILTAGTGFNFPQGLAKVTADVPWPECGNGPVDPTESTHYHSSGQYAAYYSPYPLSEHEFLVSANRDGKFVLYLMDVEGNRELISEGTYNILHAMPVRPRPRPPVLPDSVAWPQVSDRARPAPGVFFSSDIYQGAPEVLRGKAKYLRVLTIDYKTYTTWHERPYISTGPVVSGVQSDGVKRILGTVPIEADGSVSFHAPAGVPLHFQLLDGNQRALHTMRSFASLMPGESRGCQGCHELHSTAPQMPVRGLSLARRPQEITPPPWSDTSVSYARYVRPVLDQYCVKCHTGNGEGRKTVDLSARPGFLGFDETYWLLIGRPSWGQPYQAPAPPPPGWGIADMLMVEAYGTTDPAAYRTPAPMKGLSSSSRLIKLASGGTHHEVKVDSVNLQRLILWVDTMCPYRGDEEIREIPDPEFQGMDWLAVRPRIQTAPIVTRPGPF